ncbi:hypothetical protein ACIG5E_31880 [Kitasatospora sp. NPDC053057]|uniref:hypothetical protein n=1 Tax=Kitasatospora sp. NPDC053057 TaxID=3364062 RepID=UPI0037C533D6
MNTHRTSGRAAVGLVCFLPGVQVGAASVYLLQHRTKLAQPLYLAIFVLVAFGTLAVADRFIASRSAPKRRSGSSPQKPYPPAS